MALSLLCKNPSSFLVCKKFPNHHKPRSLSSVSCSPSPSPSPPPPHAQTPFPKLENDLQQWIRNHTVVGLTLAKHVASTSAKGSNLVFSPLSIHLVLCLIAAGSDSPTRDQLLSFLNAKSTDELNTLSSQLVSLVFADGGPSGGPLLSFANGVWVDQTLSLKACFKQVVDTAYKAASNHVDFQNKAVEVSNEVNQWAEKETNGLIKEVLPNGSVDRSTRLIFANALYFKGAWEAEFAVSKTKDQDFYLLNGSSVQAPFMTIKKKQFVMVYDGFKVLGLPYKQGEDKCHFNEDKCHFNIYFFLPDEKDGLPVLMEKVISENWFLGEWPPMLLQVGGFKIPKFKISFGFEVSKVLKGLGLVLPFSGGGLTEMVDSSIGGNVYVSSIFHKSFVEVNEEATETAAAAARLNFCRGQEPDFVFDRPFLFIVREEVTGAVLFIGHVLNPLAG